MDETLHVTRARRFAAALAVIVGACLMSSRVQGQDSTDEVPRSLRAGEMTRADLDLSTPPSAAQTPSAKPSTAPAAPVLARRTWPIVLVWTGAGIAVVGTAIAAGGYTAVQNAADDAKESFYTANAYGCYGAAAQCNKFNDSQSSVKVSAAVVDWAVTISAITAGGMLTAALLGEMTAPVRVQAAPSVGGIVVNGTF